MLQKIKCICPQCNSDFDTSYKNKTCCSKKCSYEYIKQNYSVDKTANQYKNLINNILGVK